MDILGISEHRWAGYGHFSTSCGGQIIYSGRERSGQSGVALFLSKAAVKSLIGYKPVNDRIITVRLMGQAKYITLIQVYAPTSPSTDEELVEFYETLQKEIDSKKRQDILIIAGDVNAKVGRKRNKEENGTVGNAGLGERNDRGEIFVDFALANQLAIKKTMFQKHPRRLYTWISPEFVYLFNRIINWKTKQHFFFFTKSINQLLILSLFQHLFIVLVITMDAINEEHGNERQYSQELLETVIDLVKSGKIGLKKASRDFNIPYSTLGEKIRGRRPVKALPKLFPAARGGG